MLAQGYCIRLSTDDDCEDICALMRRAFDYGDGSNASLNQDWWRWKYQQNPEGRYSIVCEGSEGRLLGHYGGVPSKVSCDGQELTFGQNCDSCSDPEVRRGLRNPGLFVRLAQAYASTFSGDANNALMYGLPIRSAHRIGSRYLDYWFLRNQIGLVLDHVRGLPDQSEEITVQPVHDLPADFDAFAEQQRAAFRCHADRSSSFVKWRFQDHPHTRYEIATATTRSDGSLRGYAVYRNAEFMGRSLGLLMDIMVEPGDHVALAELIRWAGARALADNQSGLFFLAAPPLPWFEQMQQWGFRAETTEYVLAARPYAAIDPAYLREHWTYTLADFDIL